MPDAVVRDGATGRPRRLRDMGDGCFAECVSVSLPSPNTYRSGTFAAAGDSALWTPPAGKSFRLMRYRFALTGNATLAAAGVLTVTLRQSTTSLPFGASVYVPAIAANTLGAYTSPWIDLGSTGYLSTVAGAVLNVNLSAALTAGLLRVLVAGTEE